jgi:hypothetical protein
MKNLMTLSSMAEQGSDSPECESECETWAVHLELSLKLEHRSEFQFQSQTPPEKKPRRRETTRSLHCIAAGIYLLSLRVALISGGFNGL